MSYSLIQNENNNQKFSNEKEFYDNISGIWS